MRCEVCGRKIHGAPITSKIEGAIMTVCVECSKHGRIVTREEVELAQRIQKTKPAGITIIPARKKPEARVQITQEMVEGYDQKIRQAREKLGLSHEDLGKKINEKASVLRKLETGKMTPNNILVTKLEHVLKVKLLVPISEEKTALPMPKPQGSQVTLGDLIQFDKKGREEPTERKQS